MIVFATHILRCLVIRPSLIAGVTLYALAMNITASELNIPKQSLKFFITQQPPYEYVDEQGVARGIAIDRFNAVFKDSHIPILFESNAIARGIQSMHKGDYDYTAVVSPDVAITSEFLVSDLPVYEIKLVAIRTKQHPPINALEELEKYDFGAFDENKFHYLKSNVSLTGLLEKAYPVKSVSSGVSLVNSGKLELFLTYYDTFVDLPAGVTFDVLQTHKVYIMTSKQHPYASDVMAYANAKLLASQ